jgi:hypothetical protein
MTIVPWVIATLVGLLLTFWCIWAIKKAGNPRRLVPYYRCLLYYLIPFTAAMLLLLGVAAYLHSSPGSLTYGDLDTAQRRIDDISSIFNRLKLAEWQILAILVAVFAINCAILSRHRRAPRSVRLPFKIANFYHKLVTPASIFLGVLCAFTFLGTEAGAARQAMELRLRTIEHGYASLVEKTDHALADRVPSALVSKAMQALPKNYVAALTKEKFS